MKKILALGEKIILRDGKEYTILPFTLEDMEWAMDKFSKINVEPIMINFYEEETRTILYEILTKILNYAHPNLSEEDVKKLIDLKIAKEILKIAIDISGYKMGGEEEEKK